MARQIVTQQLVTEAAEALVGEGSEPSIVAVQARIGGGSFSTVKRFLDTWKEMRAQDAVAAPDTPAEVQAQGQAFARAVWVLASREAQREVQRVKNDALVAVDAVRAELTQATSEIARLEAVETRLVAEIEQQQAQLRDFELALAQAQTKALRVVELEQALAEQRGEKAAARKEITDKAVEVGRLTGEVETLRTQVRELISAIGPQRTKK